jgi:SHS2 domain-containing protein
MIPPPQEAKKERTVRPLKAKRFEILDHTADIGLIVYGKDIQTLFENAGEGFFHLITDLKKVEDRVERRIELKGEGLERLMVDWLTELLYLHEVEHLLLKEFEVECAGEKGLKGMVRGEPFQDGIHEIKTQIKAVTYHQIEVREDEKGWRARIIFDL